MNEIIYYDDLTFCLFWFLVLTGLASLAGFLAEFFGPQIEKFLKGRF